MSRHRINSLTNLVDSQEAGGYTLPNDVLDAHRAYTQVKALTVEPPATLDADTAAARIVNAATAGQPVDVLAAGRELHHADQDRQAADKARHILAMAVEQAADAAANLAADRTETIITNHLRQALDDVHMKARQAAEALHGYALEPAQLITAPAKVRNAYADLTALVARRQVIYRARRWANSIGERVAEHDDNGLFAELRHPTALMPGYRPGMRPQIDAPEDPLQRLLWVVSDPVAPAQPWLPTTAEQDAAYWEQFGEAHQRQLQAHRDALAIGARIG